MAGRGLRNVPASPSPAMGTPQNMMKTPVLSQAFKKHTGQRIANVGGLMFNMLSNPPEPKEAGKITNAIFGAPAPAPAPEPKKSPEKVGAFPGLDIPAFKPKKEEAK